MVESVVIPGVPRVMLFPPGGPTLTSYCGCLNAVLEARGDSPGYPFLVAASGLATRLCWRDGWDPSNVALGRTEVQPFAPIHRALTSIGWEGTVRLTEVGGLSSVPMPAGSPVTALEARDEILSLISGGQPVIGLGVVGPPEYCILTGYADGGATVLGWSYFQEDEGYPGDSYFTKTDWLPRLAGYIVCGPLGAVPPLADTGVAMIRAAVDQARTPTVRGAHTGMAAWRVWMDQLENAGFDALPIGVPGGPATGDAFWSGTIRGRFMVYCDGLMQVHERQFAARLLRRLRAEADGPESAHALLDAAADLLTECSTYGGFLWHHISIDDSGMPKFASRDVRRILAQEGRRVAALEERAIGHLEEWLAGR